MMMRISFLFLLVFLGFFKPLAARAQLCDVIPVTITTMAEPELGTFNLWDNLYGDFKSEEKFASGLKDDDGAVVLAGERSQADAPGKDLLFVKLDYRGRELWEHSHPVKGLEEVKRVLAHPDGYIVLGTVARPGPNNGADKRSVWFGFLDFAGRMIGESVMVERIGNYYADDLLPLIEEDGYLLASHAKYDDGSFFSSVNKINHQGKPLSKRGYHSGANNRIYKLVNDGMEHYIALGVTNDADGKENGWALRMTPAMIMTWERSYPRGFESRFISGRNFVDDALIAVGQATPNDGGRDSAWIMAINKGTGEMIWERFYRGDRTYRAQDILVTEDGMISVVLNGLADKEKIVYSDFESEKAYDYVRLLTLNLRGILFFSEDFFNARGAKVSQILEGGKGERVFVGSTKSEPAPDDMEPEEYAEIDPLYDHSEYGWVVAVPGTDAYDDPCDTQLY